MSTSVASDAFGSCPEGAKIGGVLSTPAVRSVAKQLGVSIEDVPATGKGGRVTKDDVLNYAASVGDKICHDVPAASQWECEEDRTIPLRYVNIALCFCPSSKFSGTL